MTWWWRGRSDLTNPMPQLLRIKVTSMEGSQGSTNSASNHSNNKNLITTVVVMGRWKTSIHRTTSHSRRNLEIKCSKRNRGVEARGWTTLSRKVILKEISTGLNIISRQVRLTCQTMVLHRTCQKSNLRKFVVRGSRDSVLLTLTPLQTQILIRKMPNHKVLIQSSPSLNQPNQPMKKRRSAASIGPNATSAMNNVNIITPLSSVSSSRNVHTGISVSTSIPR